MRMTRTRAAVAAATLALTIGLAACGSDSADTTEAVVAETEAAPSRAWFPTSPAMALQAPSPEHRSHPHPLLNYNLPSLRNWRARAK